MKASGSQLMALGMMWGVGLMVVQALGIPSPDGGAIDWSSVAWAAPGWCAVGVALAFGVDRASTVLERPAIALFAVILSSLLLSALWTGLYTFVWTWFPQSEWAAARLTDPHGAFAYQAWLVAFYGGSYMLAWTLHRRAGRSRKLLAQVEIMELERRSRMHARELERLRGRVDPALLLHAIADARRRLANRDPSVEALLSKLVAYLRATTSQEDVDAQSEALLDELGRTHATP